MTQHTLSRRQFLVGCSSAIAALAGARLTRLAFAHPAAAGAADQQILVFVFLRGGWDALNVVPPISGADRGYYEAARVELQVPDGGADSALPLDARFGLHPAMAPLHDLYQANKLAVVHAVGLHSDTRSHFDAMQYIELGSPGVKTTTSGWLTRHLLSAPTLPSTILMPALSTGSAQAMSLLGSQEAVTMNDTGSFSFIGNWQFEAAQRAALRRIYNGDDWLYSAGVQTLDAVDLIESMNPGDYIPANGAVYPSGSFGEHLQVIAQMIKMDSGLHVATVDLGGWDTHEYQGDGSGGYMADLLAELAQGLAALYADLDGSGAANYTDRLNVVVMSEFGRRLKENGSHGTDHGHGSVMLALGGQVNGGKVFGEWPGLSNDQLYDNADLAVTTDYRRVLSEILINRLGNSDLATVFPGYTGYQPIGVVFGENIVLDQKVYIPMINRS
ncbi:MAG: DUF1501 domain-containing protein [Chloroflexi bacterium]|nr:DUF1501 domain-containing protein [Chloroflexota bacterium]